MKRRYIAQVIAMTILCNTQQATAGTESTSTDNKTEPALTFVYVHGFGEGGKATIPFKKQMDNTIKAFGVNAALQTFSYSDEKLNFLDIVDQWHQAKVVAENSGEKFYKEVILKLEQKQKPYYVVGYSLGTRVIAKCLEQSKDKLKYLKGIYFLGSALPHDAKLSSAMLPEEMKIINYHSENLDIILKVSFKVAEGKNAGGEVGFDDKKLFVNRRTVCTHARKGGPITRDYSDMAEAIAYMVLYNEGIYIKGDEPNFNLKMKTSTGALHWNDLIEFPRKEDKILIQQNVNTGHYRAVSAATDNTRRRLAWDENMHTILRQLGYITNPSPAKTKATLPTN